MEKEEVLKIEFPSYLINFPGPNRIIYKSHRVKVIGYQQKIKVTGQNIISVRKITNSQRRKCEISRNKFH